MAEPHFKYVEPCGTPLLPTTAFQRHQGQSGVKFVAIDMPEANWLTIHILAAVAEHKREAILQRTRAALAAAKTQGTLSCNSKPESAKASAIALEKAAKGDCKMDNVRRRRVIQMAVKKYAASKVFGVDIRVGTNGTYANQGHYGQYERVYPSMDCSSRQVDTSIFFQDPKILESSNLRYLSVLLA